jgi:hypothetical protein
MAKINFARPKENSKATRKSLLIVCEGARTEPSYFNSFRLPKVVEIKGVGKNTLSVVEDAVRLSTEQRYDEVWCVFDRDSFQPPRISAAFKLAEKNNIRVAFSNESFELWYLLHYSYMDSAITRKQYCDKLSEYMKCDYVKNDPKMYDLLITSQSDAIKRARKLDKLHPLIPGKEHLSIPTTSVYKLVEELNKLLKKYNL